MLKTAKSTKVKKKYKTMQKYKNVWAVFSLLYYVTYSCIQFSIFVFLKDAGLGARADRRNSFFLYFIFCIFPLSVQRGLDFGQRLQ